MCMNILGHGIDLCDTARIGDMLEKHGQRFLDRCFTPTEQEYSQKGMTARQVEFLAGRFAAKEAVVKALGTGISGGIDFINVEILREGNGRPVVKLHAHAAQRAEELGVKQIHISISHLKTHAMASAIAEG